MSETEADGDGAANKAEIDRLDEFSEALYERSLPRGGWRHALAYWVDASAKAALATGANEDRAVTLAMTISSFGACALKDALSGVEGAAAIAREEREVKLFLARLQVVALSAYLRAGAADAISFRRWWWRRIGSWFGGRARESSLGKELVIGPLCKNCLRLSANKEENKGDD